MSILSVVSNNDEAELNIIKTRNKLEDFVKQASAAETEVNIITTIDHNVASGVSRISREIMSNLTILGWPTRVGFLDKLIGEKIDLILESTDKTAMVCHLDTPLALHKRIVVVAPPFAEFENGFDQWLSKVIKLSKELSIPIQIHANAATGKAIDLELEKAKLSALTTINMFKQWDDFLILTKHVRQDDLFMLISARRGSPSHMNVLDNLPNRLERYFPTQSLIVVYPKLFAEESSSEHFPNMTVDPLTRGLESIHKIGKSFGNILKKDENKKDDDKDSPS